MKRPDPVVLISLYHWTMAVFSLAGVAMLTTLPFALAVVLHESRRAAPFMALVAFGAAIGVLCICLWAAAHVAVGWGIWTLRPWGRWGAIVLAALELWKVPVGTVIGTLILWYLFTPEGRAAFGAGENR